MVLSIRGIAHLLSLAFCLVMLCSCATRHESTHAPISPTDLAKLESQVRNHEALGYQISNGQLTFLTDLHTPAQVKVPMHLSSRVPSIQAKFNNKAPISLKLDTGAQFTVLDSRTAARLDIAIVDPKLSRVAISGVMGQEDVMLGLISPFQIGELRTIRYMCLVRKHVNTLRPKGAWRTRAVSLDLLGMDLPRRLMSYMTLDYPGKEAEFGFTPYRPKAGVPHWKAPIIWRDGLPYLRLRSGSVTWLALLDTGFSEALEIPAHIAEKAGVLKHKIFKVEGSVVAFGGGGAAEDSVIGLGLIPALHGTGPVTKNVPTLITKGFPKIGSAYLREFTVTIDFRANVLWLEDRSGKLKIAPTAKPEA